MTLLYFLGVLLLTGLDQLSKWAVSLWVKPLDTVSLWEGVFHLTYCENRGAAFGILQNRFDLFYIMTVLVLGAITLYIIKKKPKNICLFTALTMLSGGALGNFIDRVFRGYVVDFFDFRLINFAIFNVADCFVVVGAILLMVYILFFENGKHSEKQQGNE